MSGSAAANANGHVERSGILGNLTRVLQRRETIQFLVSSNLKAGHRDKLLGSVWNLLDPAFFIAIYFLVFGIGLKQAGSDPFEFAVFLSIGVLSFQFLEGVVSQAATCIRSHQGLLHAIYFPKAILPISLCFSRLYDLLWSLAVLLIALFFIGTRFSVHLAWLPVIIAVQFILNMGVAFVIAYLGAFFADTRNVSSAATRLLFFASPIFYFPRSEFGHAGIVPPELLHYYMLNPMAGLLDSYPDVLLWGRAPDFANFCYVAGVSMVILVLGFALFSRGEGDFAKYV